MSHFLKFFWLPICWVDCDVPDNGAKRSQGELLGWTCFFIGVTAVAFGSAYYHLKPNDARLVWDRLPVSFLAMKLGISQIGHNSVAIYSGYYFNVRSIIAADDYCFHFHHFNLHYWKSGWKMGDSINSSSALDWYS